MVSGFEKLLATKCFHYSLIKTMVYASKMYIFKISNLHNYQLISYEHILWFMKNKKITLIKYLLMLIYLLACD